jgi:glycine/D-amino acid oxidase-like deaminating enzyme
LADAHKVLRFHIFRSQHIVIKTTSPDTIPHLIVGAGLAGCLLAWRLKQAGERYLLIGSSAMPAAFDVAAGIINPVTGRWMTKTWNFEQLLPEALTTYRAIQQQFSIQVYHPIPEIRFCQNADDVKRAGRRLRNPRYQDVLGAYHPAEATAALEFTDPYGSFEIKQAAYVELPKVVSALRASFAADRCWRDEAFEHAALRPSPTGWHYKEIHANNVIFCEGAAACSNPWFSNLPLQPAKGETLLCQSPTLQLPQKLFHHKKWFLPYPDGSFRIGASYDEQDLSQAPTLLQKMELLAAVTASLKDRHKIQVNAHLAGIRPSSRDSRPIIGPHSKHPNLYILNGLGSKGASSAPSMTAQLVEHMLHQHLIPSEISLARFD